MKLSKNVAVLSKPENPWTVSVINPEWLVPEIEKLEADSALLDGLIEMMFEWDEERKLSAKYICVSGRHFPTHVLGGLDLNTACVFEYFDGRVNHVMRAPTPREAIEKVVAKYKEGK
jgi:hypothetical protein